MNKHTRLALGSFKVLFVLFALLSSASSSELFESLGYSQGYAQALQKAKKANKPMMLVISTKTCPWCRKLENQVLRKEVINKEVQKNFVGVGLERDDDSYPTNFSPAVVPTVLFVNPHNEKVFYDSFGYLPKKEFSKVIEEAKKKFKETNQ